MSRSLRREFEGAPYHVIIRGNPREPIYEDGADRERLMEIFAQAWERRGAEAFARCLMGSHYHFVIQTAPPILSRRMRL